MEPLHRDGGMDIGYEHRCTHMAAVLTHSLNDASVVLDEFHNLGTAHNRAPHTAYITDERVGYLTAVATQPPRATDVTAVAVEEREERQRLLPELEFHRSARDYVHEELIREVLREPLPGARLHHLPRHLRIADIVRQSHSRHITLEGLPFGGKIGCEHIDKAVVALRQTERLTAYRHPVKASRVESHPR